MPNGPVLARVTRVSFNTNMIRSNVVARMRVVARGREEAAGYRLSACALSSHLRCRVAHAVTVEISRHQALLTHPLERQESFFSAAIA